MVRIGLLSDTHGYWDEKYLKYFENCDEIWHGIPSMVYYPLPLQEQEAFTDIVREGEQLPNSELLCQQVLSLPIHTEMTEEVQNFIIEKIREYAEQGE